MSQTQGHQSVSETEGEPTPRRSVKYMEERQLVETFTNRVIEAFGTSCVAATFLPWSQPQQPPSGVVCPASNGLLDMELVRQVIQGKSIVVAACTFTYAEEEIAAKQIVAQLRELPGMCILAAHVFPRDIFINREESLRTTEIHDRISKTGVDDVFLLPDMSLNMLRTKIKILSHARLADSQHRIKAKHRESALAEEVRELEELHAQLIWKDIPRALMPRFVLPDPNLTESETGVGAYKFVRSMSSRFGTVKEATTKDHPKVVIKVVDKSRYFLPGEVEAIYREFLFSTAVLKHTNVIKAVELLHGKENIYIVFQHGGDINLKHHLLSLPGNRMSADSAVFCFWQLASAVNFIHGKMIAHRDISADHVVMCTDLDGGLCPKICDFRMATGVKSGLTSLSYCGSLPYMAPEVLFGRPCAPLPTDCWSMGVLLLEMAAGYGSFFKAVNLSDEEIELLDSEEFSRLHSVRRSIANRIHVYFDTDGNHANAVACMGAECNDGVSEILTGLLRPVGQRLPILECIRSSKAFASLGPLEHEGCS